MDADITRRRAMGLLGGTALASVAAFHIGRPPATIASPATPPASPAPASSADHVLFRIAYSGGLVPVEYLLTALPLVSVYADGRVITTGPVIEIYPQPTLPNLRLTVLAEAGIASVVERARAAGLFDAPAHYEGPLIMDLPDTVFTVDAEGVSWQISAYGLGMDESTVPDRRTAEARAKLIEFQSFLTNLAAYLPPDQIRTPDAAYEIEKIRMYAREIDPANPPWEDPAMEQPEVVWPLSTPISRFVDVNEPLLAAALRCAAFAGEEAATLADALSEANHLTPWRSDDALYQLWARPLLPDEPVACS